MLGQMTNSLPRIAVTMGDPAGVGPEICLCLLANADLALDCVPVVFGDAAVLRRVAEKLGLPFTAPIIAKAEWPHRAMESGVPSVLDLQCVDAAVVTPGQVDARCGDAAFRYVIASIAAGLAGEVDAITTAPLNKAALRASGHKYPGHTEIFAERMKAERSCMTFFSDELRAASPLSTSATTRFPPRSPLGASST